MRDQGFSPLAWDLEPVMQTSMTSNIEYSRNGRFLPPRTLSFYPKTIFVYEILPWSIYHQTAQTDNTRTAVVRLYLTSI